jgi:5-methylcytosine-specific restriction endonuclease McrA
MPAELPFSDQVKEAAFKRAGGRCECRRPDCGHQGRCQRKFAYYGSAEYHPRSNSGSNSLDNCQLLCLECHVAAHSHSHKVE